MNAHPFGIRTSPGTRRIVFSRAMQLNRRRFLATGANARAANTVQPDLVREQMPQAA